MNFVIYVRTVFSSWTALLSPRVREAASQISVTTVATSRLLSILSQDEKAQFCGLSLYQNYFATLSSVLSDFVRMCVLQRVLLVTNIVPHALVSPQVVHMC